MSLWLTDPGLRVVEESDRFFLEADEFEPLSQAAAVREAAARLLPRINGVGKLKSASFQDVGLGLVQEDDSGTVRKHAFLQLDAIRIRSRVSPVVIRVGRRAGRTIGSRRAGVRCMGSCGGFPPEQAASPGAVGRPSRPHQSVEGVGACPRIGHDDRLRRATTVSSRPERSSDLGRRRATRRLPPLPGGTRHSWRVERYAAGPARPRTLAAPAGLLGRADVERLRRVRARSGGCACARRRWRSCARRDTSLPQRSCARVVNEVSDAVVGLGPSSSC
jgi:hypothetical protein